MESDKAAVWVTNWDTERNGSSLTTRDGTSYLLANAFMLAYDYGQPHIFSGYFYAGVDDGAPGATRTSVPDMTCPTDGIETAGLPTASAFLMRTSMSATGSVMLIASFLY